MKMKNDAHTDVIIDALDMKFSKDVKLHEKILKILKKTKKEVVDPVEVFAFSADDTLLLIKRNHSRKIRHLIFLDSHTQEPFHIQNIKNFKIE